MPLPHAPFLCSLLLVLLGAAPPAAPARDKPFVFLGEEVFVDGIGELRSEPTHFYRFADAEGNTVTVLIDASTRTGKERQLGRVWLKAGSSLRRRVRLEPGSAEETAVLRYLETAIKNFDDARSATSLEVDRQFMRRSLAILKIDRARREKDRMLAP